MSQPETVKNVPNADVARVKAEFEAEGATVTVSPNSDGTTSDVTATFPDDGNGSAAVAHASAATAHASAATAHASAASAHASRATAKAAKKK